MRRRRRYRATRVVAMAIPRTPRAPRKPRRKMIPKTEKVIDEGMLIVFSVYADDEDNLPIKEILTELPDYSDWRDFYITNDAAKAAKKAEQFARRGHNAFIATVCTGTYMKLEAFPGEGYAI